MKLQIHIVHMRIYVCLFVCVPLFLSMAHLLAVHYDDWLSGEDLAGEVSAMRSTAVVGVALVIKMAQKGLRTVQKWSQWIHSADWLTHTHTHPDERAQAKNMLLAWIKERFDLRYSIYEWVSYSGPGVLRCGTSSWVVKAMVEDWSKVVRAVIARADC